VGNQTNLYQLRRQPDRFTEEEAPVLFFTNESSKNMLALRESIMSHPFRIIYAYTGVELLECVRHSDFAAIILDMEASALNAQETARRIHSVERCKDTPILFLREPIAQNQIALHRILEDLHTFAALFRKTQSLQRRIQENERENFRNLFQHTPEMIGILKGPDHVFEFVNDAHTRALGFDATGMSIRKAQPESIEVHGILDGVYRTGIAAQLQEHPITVADRLRYFNLTYSASRDENGNIIGVMVLGVEVTEQVILREAGLASEKQLQLVTDTLPALISYIDRNYHFTFANRAHEDWLEHPKETIYGRSMSEVLGHDAFEKLKPKFEAALKGERVHFQTEVSYRGSLKFIDVTYTPDLDPITHQVRGVVVLVRDISEQRRIAKELQIKSEAIEKSLNGFDIVDSTGKFIYVNRAYLKMWGYHNAEEVLGTSPAFHCADPSTPEKIVHALKETGECDLEFLAKRRDGSTFDVHMWARMAHDAQGNEIYPSSSIDITERKKTDIALQQREAYFRTLVDTSPVILWITELDNSCSYLSQQWYEFTGGTKEQDLGFGWLKRIHPEDRRISEKILKDAYAKHKSFSLDYRLRRKDGNYRWAIDSGHPRFDSEGNFLGFIGTVFDVHERWEAQEAYRKSQGNLDLALTAAKMGVFDLDLQSGKAVWSRKTEELFGYGRGEHPGTYDGFISRLHPEDQENTKNAFEVAIRNHLDYSVEYRALWSNGNIRWILSNGRALYDALGRPTRLSGIVQDITERKLAEEKILDALKARDEFLSIASHELKTPLTSLTLQTQSLKRVIAKADPTAYSPVRINRLLDQTEKQTQRLARLVDDMLDIGRIRTGKFTIEKTEVNFCELVQDIVERMRPQLEEASGSKLQIDICEPVTGLWDRFRIEQVFINLLTNAIRYGNHKPIRIRVTKIANQVQLSVEDQGIGVAKENQERIFNRFERAVSASDISGLGLGLFISKRIVDAHEGRIWVESTLGEGATFFVELPLRIQDS
jgi:PAS domain S-box-containing protein